MNESSKAMRRRMKECSFAWGTIFTGDGIDVGCGPDKLKFPTCIGFDEVDGDANHLSRYFQPNTFDYLHGSQVLEHMRDPAAALRDWLTIVKPGGYIIQTIPSWELYEGMVWPSRFNRDHKSTWSMWQKGSPAPIHCKLPEWLDQFGCKVLLCRLVDDNFDYRVGTSMDQTWVEADGVECWLEFVLQKP
jgi:SAM-dependent methyltransferase